MMSSRYVIGLLWAGFQRFQYTGILLRSKKAVIQSCNSFFRPTTYSHSEWIETPKKYGQQNMVENRNSQKRQKPGLFLHCIFVPSFRRILQDITMFQASHISKIDLESKCSHEGRFYSIKTIWIEVLCSKNLFNLLCHKPSTRCPNY